MSERSPINTGRKHRASSRRRRSLSRSLSRGRRGKHYILPDRELTNNHNKKQVVTETSSTSQPFINEPESSAAWLDPEERLDRTLSLRTCRSKEERTILTDTNDVFPPEEEESALILAPPCFITNSQESTTGSVSTMTENQTIAALDKSYNCFEKVKKKLRSKVLKSKMVSMRNGYKEESSDEETKKRTHFILQKNWSRGLSIKSETSTLQTPKITNKANTVKTFESVETKQHLPRPQSRAAEEDRLTEGAVMDIDGGEDASDSAARQQAGSVELVANTDDASQPTDDSTKVSESSESQQETTTFRTFDTSAPTISLFMDYFYCGRNHHHYDANEDFTSAGTADDDSLSTLGFPSVRDCCAELCSTRMTRRGKRLHQQDGV